MALHSLFRRALVGGLIMATACVLTPGALLADGAPVTQAQEDTEAASLIHGTPFAFVENRGQWDTPAAFVARRGGMTARVERDAMLLQLESRAEEGQTQGVVVRMAFANASENATLEGEQKLPGVCNFFRGHDTAEWQANVPRYASVIYRGLYEGVDVRVRESAAQLEYDLLLAPGADLGEIVIRCEGVEGIEVAPDGAVVMETALGPLRQGPPDTWYELPSGERRPVECRYRMVGTDAYGFEVASSDETLALVIDPTLEWLTYFGGTGPDFIGASGSAMAVDDSGLITVVGSTYSSDFHTTSGAYNESYNLNGDAYVARFDPSLPPENQLIWSTFLGGSSTDQGLGVALGSTGEVIVVGITQSTDFPVKDAYAGTFAGGVWDVYVTCLDPGETGLDQLVWSTFLGGTENDVPAAVAVDDAGIVTASGETTSDDFPTTPGAYDTSYNGAGDGVVVRLDPAQTGADQLVYATFIGGSAYDAILGRVLDSGGVVTASGWTTSSDFPTTDGAFDPTFGGVRDGFVIQLSLDGQGPDDLRYSTFVGGANRDHLAAIDMDASGVVTVGGWSDSNDFPTTPDAYSTSRSGGYDGVVLSLRPDSTGANDLLYSTYLGGTARDYVRDVCVGDAGVISVTGETRSTDFPTTLDAFDSTHNGWADMFLTRLYPKLDALVYSTYCGGVVNDAGNSLALDGPDRAVVFGWTGSTDLPTTPNACFGTYCGGDQDVFLCVFDNLPTVAPLDQVTVAGETGVWLSPPVPNPTRGPVSYRVVLPQKAAVKLEVFDVHGHRVASLFDGSLGAGTHQLEWDSGSGLSTGIYYLRLNADGVEQTQKIVFIR